MRTYLFAIAMTAVVCGSLYWCAQALSGWGPAILESPRYDPELAPFAVASFVSLWLALIALLTYAEYRAEEPLN